VTAFTLDGLKQAVVDAGLEIYRVNGTEIRIAQRVRVHLMDSAVALALRETPQVHVTVRIQRSDFPNAPAEVLFAKVREAVLQDAQARGFTELCAAARDITDPVDANHLLDVWHELTFAKPIVGLSAMIDDVRWALSVPKCVDQ